MSRHESDIMCGSICKVIKHYLPDLPNDQVTVYSTDSDLIIHAYPY